MLHVKTVYEIQFLEQVNLMVNLLLRALVLSGIWFDFTSITSIMSCALCSIVNTSLSNCNQILCHRHAVPLPMNKSLILPAP